MQVFDAHFHIIDPDFPLQSNQGYTPLLYRTEDYLQEAEKYSMTGGVVVSGSFQGYDQSYLIHALEKLGPGFVGVTQLPPSVTEEKVLELHEKGVRGVRFNIKRGGREQLRHMEELARKVHRWTGWHAELYVEASMLEELKPVIKRLPAISVDHLGLTAAGFETLLELAAEGMRVKATGFGRVDLNVPEALARIYQANSEALLFGTDLPSTRAPRPFQASDIEIIKEVLGEKGQRNVLYENAKKWYRIEPDKE
ncbi:amidohydrolase family protein [Salibacterium aidingense]|uniref:amidohydrolase family protein n=1 Tax=Salibacterium aidingense TaxID=384933 RepID=UPI00041B61C3|nr:amidohydrolase family protein [Salibacterium aidingense]